MILTKSNPGRTFDNVFDDLFGTLHSNTFQTNNYSTVPVNISEGDKGYKISFFAPARLKEAFKVSIENGLMTISYEAENKEEVQPKYLKREFTVGNFKRSFVIDKQMNTDGIEAKYEDGVLMIFIPKKEELVVTPKQITIQ